MNDVDGSVVAKKLYETIIKNDCEYLDPTAIPYALDDAVQELREKGLHSSRWGPYIHFGM